MFNFSDQIIFLIIIATILIQGIVLILISPKNKIKFVLGGLIWILGLGFGVYEIFRNKDVSRLVIMEINSIQRLMLILSVSTSVFISIFIIFYMIRYQQKILKQIFQDRKIIWLSIIFLSTGPLFSAFLGEVPYFFYGLLLLPIIMTAVVFCPLVEKDWVLKQIKYVLIVFIFGSLISLIITPDWATIYYPSSLIPGINYRLFGLASHPNSLGPMAVTLIFINLLLPYKKKFINLLLVSGAIIILLLAQSKTAWLAFIFGFSMIILSRIFISQKRVFFLSQTILLFILASILVVLRINTEIIENFIANPTFLSLTGRTYIWDISLSVFKKNIFFGYGPTLWDLAFRTQYGLMFAGHSHNQFFQTLAESGLYGFIGLLSYLVVLIIYSFKVSKITRGVSLGLLMILLTRVITETPLRLYLLDNSFFLHLVLFLVILIFNSMLNQQKELPSQKFS